uniref:Nidogen-2-like n=1 Tax=Phallusia mammillata TaxID=59560 RepID=A0A6F9DMW0_9ASCI|nr:nidogen-2-like [Phallusia mammillata]
MFRSTLLLLVAVAFVDAVTVKDLYPHGGRLSAKLNHGDLRKSPRIALATPAKFYNNEYDYLWVHVDGYISFEPDTSDAPHQDFPFGETLLAPYMADLDTTNRGEVFFYEHHDEETLSRATSDVRRAFGGATDFEAESAFVVTWKDVEGESLDNQVASFTFQLVLVSNGRDTYAIFLYPEQKMGASLDDKALNDPIFRARAGFNEGPNNFLEMFPVDSLVDYRNTAQNGEWIFQIGGEGVRQNRDVITPQGARHRKRQTNHLINVQDVTLTDEVDDVVTRNDPSRDYCSRVQDPCPDPNSRCAGHPTGFCCKCNHNFFGNGKVCLADDAPVRANGNVSGVVDVKDRTTGVVNRTRVSDVHFHSYVIPNQGRAYTAISGVTPGLGRALQPMSVIGEIVGWLFADSGPSAANGFHYTGGNFQRRVSVKYTEGGYHFDLRQKFYGISMEGEVPIVLSKTDFVGIIPDIQANEIVKIGELVETYTRNGQGQISSSARRTYTVNDTSYTYDVTQTIIFHECAEASNHIPNELTLKVFGIFLNYQEFDDNVRFAMNNQITVADGAVVPNPCVTATHDCDVNAVCEPQAGAEYTCRCVNGYVGDGRSCVSVRACATARCPPNSTCIDTAQGSYYCECNQGFEQNEVGECQEIQVEPTPADPCSNGPCGAGSCVSIGSTYSCNCQSGYYYDGQHCEDLDECLENRHNCDAEAVCTNIEGSFQCACNPGFEGNGIVCTKTVVQSPDMTECQRQYAEVDEIIKTNPGLQDGPEHPDCMADGSFAPRQCNGFTQVCWCVETELGGIIESTMTQPGFGFQLDCSDPQRIQESTPVPQPPSPPTGLTQCQTDRWEATQGQASDPSRGPIFQPLCTLAGAYEPLQYHPSGYYLCVDFNGVEVSRHRDQPQCLTTCQLTAYYADTENIFVGTNNFVPQCDDSGNYARVQCDVNSRSCYCADQNGLEVPNTRINTENPESITIANLDCDRLTQPRSDLAAQLIFAKGMGYNSVLLPITTSSVAERIFARAGQTVVAVAFDCSKQTVYWTDVAGGAIYSAPLSDESARKTVIKTGIRGPEGIAVDYVSGNIYWTDTGLNKIKVARADGSSPMVLVSSGISDPRGIAVDPFGAKIYWTEWDRKDPRIMQANTDGTDVQVFLRDGVNLPNDVTIDQFHRRLCYLDAGSGRQRVECMNLDGSQRTVTLDIASGNLPTGIRPFGLDVDGGMVYFSDRSGRVFAADTTSGTTVSTGGPVGSHGQALGIAIAHSQCAQGVNGCSRLYGGCSHLCLPVAGGRVCKCPSEATDCTEQ